MSCVTPHGISILCILVLSIFFAHAAGAAESPVSIKVSTAQVQALDIKTETLASAGDAIKRRLPAWVVVPAHAVHVTSSPIAGLVTDILVESHQRIAAQTPLLRIVSRELGELQLQLLQAAAQSTLAAQTAARDQQLFKEGIIPQRRWQEAQAGLAQAQAVFQQSKAALQLSGLSAAAIAQLAASGVPQDSITLSSGTTGIVTKILIEPGQRVEPSTALLHMADTRVLWLDIQVAAADLNNWPRGSKLTVAGRAVSAHVRSSSPTVASASQMAILRAQIDNTTHTLLPGEMVTVELPASAASTGWNLPLTAIAHDGNQAYVFVRSAAGFEGRPVTVIDSAGVRVRLEGALAAGEEVAVSGVVALKAAWLEAQEPR